MIRIALTVLLLALSAGCTMLSGITQGEDNAPPPAPLQDFEAGVEVSKRWSTDAGAGFGEYSLQLQPAVNDGRVYVAGHDGRVVALDAVTGRKLWSADTGVAVSGGPGVGDGLVLVGSSNAQLVALEATDGSERWRTELSSEVLSVPQTDFDRVIVQTADGNITALDAEDGTQAWIYDRSVPVLTLRGTSTPAVQHGIVVAGFSSGKLAALDADKGLVAWETSIAIPQGRSELERIVDIDGDPVIQGAVVFVSTYQGNVAAVELRSGNVGWKRNMSSHTGLAVDYARVYVTDDESHVWALSRTTGTAEWKTDALINRGLTVPALFGDYLAVADFEGYVHLLKRRNGELAARFRVDGDGIRARPLVVDDVLYVYGNSGKLAAYTLE